MKSLFNTNTYNKLFEYLSSSTIQDPFRKCNKFLGGPYFVLRRGFDSSFEIQFNDYPQIEQDLSWLFNVEDCQRLKKVTNKRINKKREYAKVDCGRFKDLKLNLYLYEYIRKHKLVLYHDNVYRSGLFYAYKDKKLIAVLQGIRT